MYIRRLRLVNYGPITDLEISFPFVGSVPRPVVLVGENGSGKSILLSHIVNGLIQATSVTFPESPELTEGKVFKVRSPLYIKVGGNQFYFARVDFDDDLYMDELQLWKKRKLYSDPPRGISIDGASTLWDTLDPEETQVFRTNISRVRPSPNEQQLEDERKVAKLVTNNCILYFPSNRFEDPAWLNSENLTREARYLGREHTTRKTGRRVITLSPLRDNQDWLFDVLYDRAVFELRPSWSHRDGQVAPSITYMGKSQTIYEVIVQLVHAITNRTDTRIGIGPRSGRFVSIRTDTDALVHNLFQSSSGECSLLNLFLSILRDADLSDMSFEKASDITGIVVVDEIDLHLHTMHQYEILPRLIQMFPKVQFIVTSHSPLFVLGMTERFGENGVGLYRLPRGTRISSEEFSEFGTAYSAFTATAKYSSDINDLLAKAERPVLLVEGKTDKRYLERAAVLLGRTDLLSRLQVKDGGGADKLAKVWKGFTDETVEILPFRVLLLFDCDRNYQSNERGSLYRRVVPQISGNPIQSGIENLFSERTLERALNTKQAFIDITDEHPRTVRGRREIVPESWVVNENEKTNLCTWICENGTSTDFDQFRVVFEIIQDTLGDGGG